MHAGGHPAIGQRDFLCGEFTRIQDGERGQGRFLSKDVEKEKAKAPEHRQKENRPATIEVGGKEFHDLVNQGLP